MTISSSSSVVLTSYSVFCRFRNVSNKCRRSTNVRYRRGNNPYKCVNGSTLFKSIETSFPVLGSMTRTLLLALVPFEDTASFSFDGRNPCSAIDIDRAVEGWCRAVTSGYGNDVARRRRCGMHGGRRGRNGRRSITPVSRTNAVEVEKFEETFGDRSEQNVCNYQSHIELNVNKSGTRMQVQKSGWMSFSIALDLCMHINIRMQISLF
jgi:hypothetical protein